MLSTVRRDVHLTSSAKEDDPAKYHDSQRRVSILLQQLQAQIQMWVTRKLPELRVPKAAGAGRGSDNRRPVCISYQEQPDGQDQWAEARRIRNRLTLLLDVLDLPHRDLGPIWKEEGAQDQGQPPSSQHQRQPITLSPPPFIVAQQCERLVLTTWGDIYEAPRVMWEQNGGNEAQALAVAALSGEEVVSWQH